MNMKKIGPLVLALSIAGSSAAAGPKREMKDIAERVVIKGINDFIEQIVHEQISKEPQEGVFLRDGAYYYRDGGKIRRLTTMQEIKEADNEYIYGTTFAVRGKYVYFMSSNGTKLLCIDLKSGDKFGLDIIKVLKKLEMPFIISPSLAAAGDGVYFTFNGSRSIFYTDPMLIKKSAVIYSKLDNFLKSANIIEPKIEIIDEDESILLIRGRGLKCPVVMKMDKQICIRELFEE